MRFPKFICYVVQNLKVSFSHFFAEATLAIFNNVIIDILIDDIMDKEFSYIS